MALRNRSLTGRLGRGIELDPHYVDAAICRWQALTGQPDQLVRMTAYDALMTVPPPHLKPTRWSTIGGERSDYMPGRWGDA